MWADNERLGRARQVRSTFLTILLSHSFPLPPKERSSEQHPLILGCNTSLALLKAVALQLFTKLQSKTQRKFWQTLKCTFNWPIKIFFFFFLPKDKGQVWSVLFQMLCYYDFTMCFGFIKPWSQHKAHYMPRNNIIFFHRVNNTIHQFCCHDKFSIQIADQFVWAFSQSCGETNNYFSCQVSQMLEL